MCILGAAALPHPPLIIPEVGRGSETVVQPTIDAYRRAARWLQDLGAQTLIIISPHSPLFEDGFFLAPGPAGSGDLRRFGARQVSFELDYDEELRRLIERQARAEGLQTGGRPTPLDHGVMVPLYFLREAAGGRLPWRAVQLGLSGLSFAAHYRMGRLIARAAGHLGRRAAVVASGDLSHYLKEDGPYGLRPQGARYDRKVMDILSRAAFGELLDMDPGFCGQAGECGQRSLLVMAGCLDGRAVGVERLSYQDVTGVGYGVCLFEPGEEDAARRFLDRPSADPYVALALQSLTSYVTAGRLLPRPAGLPDELTGRRAGAFVSLHLDGRLRGCIGTISPTEACLADEIIRNAVSAAVRDPRFDPVRAEEIPRLECSVDVLEPPEDIQSPDQLDVKEYGVIVSLGARRGLLLPNLDGVDSVAQQIDIARQKAGIPRGAPYTLQRFRVVRHT